MNIINSDIDLKIEKLPESQYKIICTAYSDINAYVSLNINYKSNYLNSIFNNCVFAKYVHITYVTKNSIYNNLHVNYFIPPNSEGYEIPITIVNGIDEIIISSYPQKNTSLNIYNIKVNEVIKNPFLELKTSNLTDTNWIIGISRSNNVLLFSNNTFNNMMLDGATSLVVGDKTAKVVAIEDKGDWIHVTIDGNKEAFFYPNIIKVIKSK